MKKIFHLVDWKELFKGFLFIFLYMLVIPNLVLVFFRIWNLDISTPNYYILANVLIYVFTLIMIFVVFRICIFQEGDLYAKNLKTEFWIGF